MAMDIALINQYVRRIHMDFHTPEVEPDEENWPKKGPSLSKQALSWTLSKQAVCGNYGGKIKG